MRHHKYIIAKSSMLNLECDGAQWLCETNTNINRMFMLVYKQGNEPLSLIELQWERTNSSCVSFSATLQDQRWHNLLGIGIVHNRPVSMARL